MSGRCLLPDSLECRWTQTLWSTIPIALLATGTVGNLLNIVVLSRKRMRTFSISVYLMCLSIADLTFLWWGMVPRMLLQGYKNNIRAESAFLCKMISWAPVTSAGFSVWILAILTVERVILTRWPIAARATINRKTSTIAVITTFIGVCCFTIHVPFSSEIKTVVRYGENGTVLGITARCSYASAADATFYSKYWPLLVLTALNLLPMTVVVAGNLNILFTIISQNRKLRRIKPSSQVSQEMFPRKVKSATKMLFLVSAVLIITTLPFTLGNVIMALTTPTSPKQTIQRHLVYTILRHMMYCNFSFNFVLYFVSGTLFKTEWNNIIVEVKEKLSEFFSRAQHQELPFVQTISSKLSNIPETEETRSKRTF